jgi:hypothetical protein
MIGLHSLCVMIGLHSLCVMIGLHSLCVMIGLHSLCVMIGLHSLCVMIGLHSLCVMIGLHSLCVMIGLHRGSQVHDATLTPPHSRQLTAPACPLPPAAGQFAQYEGLRLNTTEQGAKWYGGVNNEARLCYYAERTKNLSRVWKEVWGAEADRVVVVAQGQAVWPLTSDKVLSCRWVVGRPGVLTAVLCQTDVRCWVVHAPACKQPLLSTVC